MKKTRVYLDMDGTIFNLYGKKNWLARLESEDETVFGGDERLTTEEVLKSVFPKDHYEVIVLSMTPKNASAEYCQRVIEMKNAWLDAYFPSISKRIYRKYGNNKNLKNSKNAILVDDNQKIRENWNGLALDPITLWG